METSVRSRSYNARLSSSLLFAASAVVCVIWIGIQTAGMELPLVVSTLLAGLAIFGAAFMLTWFAELAQADIPQSLAIAFVAFVAVLPEYAVDMYYAWTAGKDASYTQFAAANMTGANRLLIGSGWVAVLLFYWMRSKSTYVLVGIRRRVEMLALLMATLYAFVIPIKGRLSLVDTGAMFLIFVWYIRAAIQSGVEQPEVEGGVVEILSALKTIPRRIVAVLIFLVAGWAVLVASKPFAEGLLGVGAAFGIDQFLLVQWIAPIASEAPEFIVAIIFAWRFKPDLGLSTLISSKVNQWTLLVGMLPLAYCVSSGSLASMVLDGRQTAEVFLTAAQSFFALIVIMDLKFSWRAALVLFVLFASQVLIPTLLARYIYGGAYIAMAVFLLVRSRLLRNGLKHTGRLIWKIPQRAVPDEPSGDHYEL